MLANRTVIEAFAARHPWRKTLEPAGLVPVAAGFAAERDESSERNATIAKRLVWVGVLVVAVPLAYHSWERLEESTIRAELVRGARGWAGSLTVREVEVDRAADPVQVTVTVTGAEEPSGPDELAGMVAEELRRAVEFDIVYVPISEGSAPAP